MYGASKLRVLNYSIQQEVARVTLVVWVCGDGGSYVVI